MGDWTITGETTSGTFAALDIEPPRANFRSRAADVLTLRVPREWDADPLFAYLESVQIHHPDGRRYFLGVLTETPRFVEEEGGEWHEYVFSGPWWHLENIAYQQMWNQAADPEDPESVLEEQLRSRVLLQQRPDGTKKNTGEEITEILDYAIAAGAPLQIGDMHPSADVPIDELQDPMCSEAIQRALRVHPDVQTVIDYETSPPTIHFRRRADSPVHTLAAADLFPQLRIRSRDNLLVSAVVLRYEIRNQTDTKTWLTGQVDAVPAGATGAEVGALVATIELGGQESTYQRQPVETDDFQPSSATWWKKKIPNLKNVTDLAITDVVVDPETPVFSREIIDGQTPPWKTSSTERVEVTARASYQYTDVETGAEVAVEDQEIGAEVNATSLVTATYARQLTFTPPEPVPENLAQTLYDALTQLHWQGAVSFTAEEIPALIRPGAILRITGGRAEWATMDAVIQEVAEEAGPGRTIVTFGPPEHLGPQDRLEHIRANRRRTTSYRQAIRQTGESAGTNVTGGSRSQNTNASPGPNGGGGNAAILHRMQVQAIHQDYLECRTWDGTTLGEHTLNVARPRLLRPLLAAWQNANPAITEFADITDQELTAKTAEEEEDWIMTPKYAVGAEIFARKVTGGTGVTVADVELRWIDANNEARAYAAP